nr:unnamed protein product [Timema californicum]
MEKNNDVLTAPEVYGEEFEELEELLDSALKDFDQPISSTPLTHPIEEHKKAFNATKWSEEFFKQATDEFERSMQSLLTGGEPLTPEAIKTSFNKVAEATSLTAKDLENRNGNDIDCSSVIAQTVKNLAEGKQDILKPFSEEEIMNMFSEIGLGDGSGGSEDLIPMMNSIMQSLLSKDVLYPALKDLSDKYPSWLEEKASQLSSADLERYTKQKVIMLQICKEFEKETKDDSSDTKKHRFENIMKLMTQMQECGQPPQDLYIGELGLNFDETRNAPLPPGINPSQCQQM